MSYTKYTVSYKFKGKGAWYSNKNTALPTDREGTVEFVDDLLGGNSEIPLPAVSEVRIKRNPGK